MKYAFLSDIHGNAVALEAVLKDIEAEKVEKIFVLGDICYRGPEPKRALDMVRSLDATVIKGNADEWMVRGVKQGEVPEQALAMMNKEREWCLSRLNKEDLDYLSSLPTDFQFTLNNKKTIYAFHATPTSLFEVVLPSAPELEAKLTETSQADIYLYAHIHLPYIQYINGKCIGNLGSVGLPFDGQPLSSYILVEENKDLFTITIKRVLYDTNLVIKQYEVGNYPNLELMKRVIAQGESPFK